MFSIFTGKGNQGKSLFSNPCPIWVKIHDDVSYTMWSNEDNIDQEPEGAGFIKYENFKRWYEENFLLQA